MAPPLRLRRPLAPESLDDPLRLQRADAEPLQRVPRQLQRQLPLTEHDLAHALRQQIPALVFVVSPDDDINLTCG